MSKSAMILNYTPHTICVRAGDPEQEVKYLSSGDARVEEDQEIVDRINGFEVKRTVYKGIIGLPPEPDTYYLVSMVVAQANNKSTSPRTDLLSPNTGKDCIREHGIIVAVRGFVRH